MAAHRERDIIVKRPEHRMTLLYMPADRKLSNDENTLCLKIKIVVNHQKVLASRFEKHAAHVSFEVQRCESDSEKYV